LPGIKHSSPTKIVKAIDVLAKCTSKIMYKIALMQAEIRDVWAAKEALSKRRRAKKTAATRRIAFCTGCTGFTGSKYRVKRLRCRLRRKRRRVVVGSRGSRHAHGVVALSHVDHVM